MIRLYLKTLVEGTDETFRDGLMIPVVTEFTLPSKRAPLSRKLCR